MKLLQTTERELIRQMFRKFPPDGWRGFASIVRVTCDYFAGKDPETITAEEIRKNTEHGGCLDGFRCNECNKHSLTVIELGEEPDYESHTAQICPACFEKAVAMMRLSKQWCAYWGSQQGPRMPDRILNSGEQIPQANGSISITSADEPLLIFYRNGDEPIPLSHLKWKEMEELPEVLRENRADCPPRSGRQVKTILSPRSLCL